MTWTTYSNYCASTVMDHTTMYMYTVYNLLPIAHKRSCIHPIVISIMSLECRPQISGSSLAIPHGPPKRNPITKQTQQDDGCATQSPTARSSPSKL